MTKVALITGANKGIGFETTKQLAKQGIKVLLGARDNNKGLEAVNKLKAEGLDVEYVNLDVDNFETHKSVGNYIQEKYGKLDILINNAGIMEAPKSVIEQNIEIFKKVFDTNFFNVIALTQTLLPLVRKSEAGRIVNLSSLLGSLTSHSDKNSFIYNFKSVPAYNASKSALNAFTVHLAYELKDTNIKVNSAHPGWVKTDMGGEQAPMELEDGAKTSVWLATLPSDGPTGGFYHFQETVNW
ncbi:MAG: SDR family oxidoreductase [Candidatus Sericytochromatia bacterium]